MKFTVRLFLGNYWVFENGLPAEGWFRTKKEAQQAARNMRKAWA